MQSQSGRTAIGLFGAGTNGVQVSRLGRSHGHGQISLSSTPLSSTLRLRLPCVRVGVGVGVPSLSSRSRLEVGEIHKIESALRATSDRSLDPNLDLIPSLDFDLIDEKEQARETHESGSIEMATSNRNKNRNRNSSRNRNGMALALGLMFASWNFFNIYFNIFNKQILKVYAFPMTLTTVQFGIGSVLILLMWAMNLHERPKISLSQLRVIAALAAVHTMGNIFTNMSLLKVAVSFTHTVKAMEPLFSVFLSSLFLGQQPSGMVIATLVPVVGGVALASFTEASFNWIGFWSAMASNLANQSRNVVSKKLMANKEESLSNINLFSLITIISFFFSMLIMICTEGITFTPSYLQASGLDSREIYVRSLLAGVCFHAYQQAGYMLLEHVSPVSHSVGNCVKRVVVIVASVLFFRTPISFINSLGTGIALVGVFLYSRVKKVKRTSP